MSGRGVIGRWPARLAVCLLASAAVEAADGRVIHKERSLYQEVLVEETGRKVCLKFSTRREELNQSCMDRDRPRKMLFSYTRMMMAALLLNPSPRRILIAGLGGGTLPTALAELYPQAIIDVVEIDAAVVAAAQRFFGFAASPRLRVHTQDARAFVKRAARNGQAYDLIMLDAFTGEYIPEHLMTREFLIETRDLLAEDGALAANTFAYSRLYDHESTTYSDVYGTFFNLRLPNSSNRVILATHRELPNAALLRQRAAALREPLRPFAVDIQKFPLYLPGKEDWDGDARVLTDQYSPANLLRRR